MEEKEVIQLETITAFVEDLNERLAKSVQEDKGRRFRNGCRRFFKNNEVPYLTMKSLGYVVDVADGPTESVLIFYKDDVVQMAPYEPVVEEEEEEEEEVIE